ncbi:hypothetical protein MLD38_035315 [Melastoma candidum]|uniref:Uncharacterized protein n=1 Tax=Melastoma candidum TaxID=119954 RepID=A0ACB9MCN1_9MYRT|nr:hypothetical protein MLD38_035315 [Melastoma candidum]
MGKAASTNWNIADLIWCWHLRLTDKARHRLRVVTDPQSSRDVAVEFEFEKVGNIERFIQQINRHRDKSVCSFWRFTIIPVPNRQDRVTELFTAGGMGSGLSCFRCLQSCHGRDFRPPLRDMGEENDSERLQRKYLTLEDWLSADDCKIQALRHSSIKTHDSLLSDIDRAGDEGEFSSGWPDDTTGKAGRSDLEVVASFERSFSSKTQKRVSFRLPEQSDVIVFYSPGRGCSRLEAQKRDEHSHAL